MPNHYLAIDIGSSTVAAAVIDLDSKSVVGSASVANTAEITSPEDKKIGRSEWDLEVMTELAVQNAADLIRATGADPAAIGVTASSRACNSSTTISTRSACSSRGRTSGRKNSCPASSARISTSWAISAGP
jgi:hypothetical protein